MRTGKTCSPWARLFVLLALLGSGTLVLWAQSPLEKRYRGVPDPEKVVRRTPAVVIDRAAEVELIKVGFSLSAFDTLVGEEPALLLGVETLDEELIADFTVTLELPPELASGYLEARPYFINLGELVWELHSDLSGNLLTISANGTDHPDYDGIHSLGPRGEIAEIRFQPLPAGSYSITLAGGQVTHQGTPVQGIELAYQDDTLEVGLARIKTDILPTGKGGKGYDHQLAFAHLAMPLSLEIIGGALPPGYSLHEHDLVSARDVLGQAGSYSFTLRATDADGLQVDQGLTLKVEPEGPELSSVLLVEDRDGDGGVSMGDTLRLVFDENVVLGPNALQLLNLSEAGDRLGEGASIAIHDEYASWVDVTLGKDVSLSILSAWSPNNVGLSLLAGSGGIADGEGDPAFSAEPVRILLANTIDIADPVWVVGQPIEPIVFTPFSSIPSGVSADGLPAGLEVEGEAVVGTPAAEAVGTFGDDLYTVVIRRGLDVLARAWVIVYQQDPRVSFGPVEDPSSRLALRSLSAHFGAVLELDIIGANTAGQRVHVFVDGLELVPAPGSQSDLVRALLPSEGLDGTYQLWVTQDGQISKSVDLNLESVKMPANAVAPYIDHTWYFESEPGKGWFSVVGEGLGEDSFYTLDGQSLNVWAAGDTFAVLELPPDFDYYDFTRGYELTVVTKNGDPGSLGREPNPETETYLDGYFNGNFLGDPIKPPNVLFQENKNNDNNNDEWKEVVEAFCKTLCDIIDETDKGKTEKLKKRIKNFLKAIAAHESKFFKARVQCGGGPGVTYGQIEPNTLRTILCDRSKKRYKAVKDMIVKCTGLPEKEVCEMLDGFKKEKGNNWNGPNGKKLKKILSKGGKAGDKFAALLMRLYFKTKAGQSFDHPEYDDPKPGEGEKTKEKCKDVPVGTGSGEDPNGKDIYSCGNETGKYFYAEQWRKYYHGGTNKRPCKKWSEPDENGKRTCVEYKSDAAWKACREKLRKRFVENFCKFIEMLK